MVNLNCVTGLSEDWRGVSFQAVSFWNTCNIALFAVLALKLSLVFLMVLVLNVNLNGDSGSDYKTKN